MGQAAARGALGHRAHRVTAHHAAGGKRRAIGQAGVAAHPVIGGGAGGVGQGHGFAADYAHVAGNRSWQVVVAQHGGTCDAVVAARKRHSDQLVGARICTVVST